MRQPSCTKPVRVTQPIGSPIDCTKSSRETTTLTGSRSNLGRPHQCRLKLPPSCTVPTAAHPSRFTSRCSQFCGPPTHSLCWDGADGTPARIRLNTSRYTHIGGIASSPKSSQSPIARSNVWWRVRQPKWICATNLRFNTHFTAMIFTLKFMTAWRTWPACYIDQNAGTSGGIDLTTDSSRFRCAILQPWLRQTRISRHPHLARLARSGFLSA